MAKILLVEDDNNLREIYEARLQAEGYDIVAAMNGEEALVVAKKERPDLIISDVMMPRISGFEMLDILRNTEGLHDVKIIMLTALGQAEDKTRADALGADRYLVKSQVTLEDIVKAVHELLAPAAVAVPSTIEAPQPEAPAAPAEIAAPAVAAPQPEPAPATPAPAPAVAPEPQAPVAQPSIPVAAPPEPTAAPVAGGITVVPPEPAATDTVITDTVVPAPVDNSSVPTPDTSTAAPIQPAPTVDEPAAPAPTPAADASAPAPEPTNTTPSGLSTPETQIEASHPQSTSAEEATVRAQIENFVNQPVPATENTDTASMPVNAPTAVEPPAAPTPAAPSPAADAAPAPAPAEPAMPTAPAQPVDSAIPVAPAPAEPTQPAVDPNAAPAAAPANEQAPHIVMEEALKDLMANTKLPAPEPAAPVVLQPITVAPPQPETPVTPGAPAPAVGAPQAPAPAAPVQDLGDGSTATHKKVISPISNLDTDKPEDLAQLLAKEGITSFDEEQPQSYAAPVQPAAAQPASVQPAPPVAQPLPVQPSPAPAPAAPIQPPAIAPVTPPTSGAPTSQHPPGHVISPTDNQDPNRIAL